MGSTRNDRNRSSGSATTALLIRFGTWFGRHAASTDHEHLASDDAKALLAELFSVSSGALRTPTVPVLRTLLAAIDADPELSPMQPHLVDILEHYLDFVVETGAWAPADSEIDASYEILAEASDDGGGLLLDLIDALDEVDDVPEAAAREALAALPAGLRGEDGLLERLREAFSELDPERPIGALVIERVLGVLCVATAPTLLPGVGHDEILALLDEDAAASEQDVALASPLTDGIIAGLSRDGIVGTDGGPSDGGRLVAPEGLRPALADAVLDLAEEYGLTESLNPHPEGTVLQLKVSVADSEPAVWRRLELEAGADLGELHLAIQLSLDWTDSAPHRFTPDPEGEEDEVEIGELLFGLGDELVYEYDEGPARVVVRLDGLLEGSDARLPRCVDSSPEIDAAEADGLLAPLRLR
ncbi:IS1096 element passenger TnpR family protein [Herbiconiux liukaitaii]|uniref:IS1096 element passenger TnpR family protein n=1 Tax=Herbiconiux liukaitaii TaxID=3342799 RepID=UPI0035BB023E